jgi:predicted DNA-binding transcriptional regulator AlpA
MLSDEILKQLDEAKRPLRVLRRRETCDRAGFTASSTLYDAMERHDFPRPIKLGGSGRHAAVGWIEEEVVRWIEARIAARNARGNAARPRTRNSNTESGADASRRVPHRGGHRSHAPVALGTPFGMSRASAEGAEQCETKSNTP